MGHNAEGVLPMRKNLAQVEKWWNYLPVVCKAEICKSKAEKVQGGHSCQDWKGRSGIRGCWWM